MLQEKKFSAKNELPRSKLRGIKTLTQKTKTR